MAAVKLNICLDQRAAGMLREQATAKGQPISRYLSDLITADAIKSREELMIQGYRELDGDTATWLAVSEPTDLEGWPEWNDENARA